MDYEALSVQELDVILRDREMRGVFDSETTMLRSLIEAKKLGQTDKGE